MFTKVLIANRGAIACRIIRTLDRLGVDSVAVYAESDANSLHVRQASESFSLGDGPANETYLDQDKIIEIALKSGVQAIHPGYGFLSENSEFVSRCEAAGIAFIGPTPKQIEQFGLKHEARELAARSGVPLTPGSDLLRDLDAAIRAAANIGYPVMLKATAGGGGIGMKLCADEQQLKEAFESVKRLGANNFSDDGVFLEKFIARARHIEVQVFGDGKGNALAIGERDCSSQRRNQKVLEECPAPHLSKEVRQQLHRTAESLLASVNYRNAGTVEYIFDADSNQFYFLEVNTRLQVEHGVTEEVFGLDLVEWMLRLASGETIDIDKDKLKPKGHAVQVRVYAEDPYRNFQPSPGLLSFVSFPEKEGLRIDHWIESGIEVPPYFDPMLAKIIVHANKRNEALIDLKQALDTCEIYGSPTNIEYLSALVQDHRLIDGTVTTRYLDEFSYQSKRIEVIQGGTQTTIQDYPAREGYWDVGVPPSGPFDPYSFQLANQLLGNSSDAAGLEITIQGPTLRFSCDCQFVLGGADIHADVDGSKVPMWQVVTVKKGQTLSIGRITGQGARAYLVVSGGLQCPDYLGSKSTFTLGQFGGHNGRALVTGDVLSINPANSAQTSEILASKLTPVISDHWNIRVIYGPHGAPDFFTDEDIERFFEHEWEVHYNSSRTGIRLIGPKPEWARKNGGEAGLHPSNIHDNAYAFGTVDFTGDMPVILGPDGPSLGGFVCPATVIHADLWKLGQLKAGDKIRFSNVSLETALALEQAQTKAISNLVAVDTQWHVAEIDSPIFHRIEAQSEKDTDITFRIAGDHFLLVEYGEQTLDIALRFRAHALMRWLQEQHRHGIKELTPGIRSLQIHYDPKILSTSQLVELLESAESDLKNRIQDLKVPSRIVHIPLSWDDQACQKAIDKYDQSVRKNAPWCPSNLEFIRRINGLDCIQDVKEILFSASYLVMGLGDVYLGAPVATPVDPRHRLVTTKYNPARTWTAENSVGIGGSYLCVYGMEGPGGYQFVGRTLQMWNRYRQTQEFSKPWLLRFFDQIRFYEVSHDELTTIRKNFPQGRYPIKIEQSEFSLSHYQQFLDSNAADIDSFKTNREQAFDEELARWHAEGQFNFEIIENEAEQAEQDWEEGSVVIDSPVSGSAWQINCALEQHVEQGECLMILESMKMEIPVYASESGTIKQIRIKETQGVKAGQALIVIEAN